MASSSQPAVAKMENRLYTATSEGKVEILVDNMNNENLRSKTYEENNIIHIAIRHEQYDFVKACLIKFTKNDELFSDKNSKGDTTLHVAAEVGNLSIVKLLYEYLGDRNLLWKEKNSKGNTPLHVAIIHNNVDIATFLLEMDSKLAEIDNNSMEAPLHLAIKQHVNCSECDSILAKARKPINEGGAALKFKPAPLEDMNNLIKLLVQKASIVTCWPDHPDANGLTPLQQVAYLSKPHNIELTNFILDNCRQSAEVCDKFGRSILHHLINKIPDYQETKILLSRRELHALRNYQDHQGNTPLHMAAKGKDINMVRVLLESSVKLNINNVEGVSAASLIEHDVFQMLRKRILTKGEIDATERININFLNERMSKLGDDFFLAQDSKGKNILHKTLLIKKGSRIMLEDFLKFIEESLRKFPSLICQKDSKGDTPIHVLVRNDPDTKIYVTSRDQNSDGNPTYVDSSLWKSKLLPSILEKCNLCILNEANSVDGARFNSPWLVQNVDGNTPLHEAIKSNNNNEMVKQLLKYNKDQLCVANKHKDTPLHLFAKNFVGTAEYKRSDVKELVNANVDAAYSLDQEGLTPLLRAYRVGNHPAASMLCKASLNAAMIGDKNSQTYGHLIVKHPSEYYFSGLFRDKELRKLLELKDANGNTPLHLAIMDERFDLVRFFLDFWDEQRKLSKGKDDHHSWLVDLLELSNRSGKTPNDLLAESPSLPSDIKDTILGEKEMIGVLSTWGIPLNEMNSYVSTIGIIAALLTTITFTTAFTVPGGNLENIGTPVLIGKIAFQVFMVLDIVAMCLSMMVLCCLLWIMATNNRKSSVMILDFSVTMVLASFCTTLLTFMAGLCATTLPVKAWMAYFTLGLCTLLIFLVYKDIIIKLLIPGKNAIVNFVRKFLWSPCIYPKKTNSSTPDLEAADQQLPRQGNSPSNV